MYTLETGNESSSDKDLRSFVGEKRHFFKPKDK